MNRVLHLIFNILLLCVSSKTLGGFVPENDLFIFDAPQQANLDETKFNELLTEVQTAYQPVIRKLGGRLRIVGIWDSPEVNAHATRDKVYWYVRVLGGLARRPEISPDAMSLIVCHEVGHHIAGWPFYPGRWAAAEGQADYFSTQACAKVLWREKLSENLLFRSIVSEKVRRTCDGLHKNASEQDLCYRMLWASKAVGEFLAFFEGTNVDFETADTSTVDYTLYTHPSAQCRFDTLVAGALCMKAFPQDSIPSGAASAKASSCSRSEGYDVGYRPRCWFGPSF
ncbi:MAG: hypothetical protein AB7T49_09895 [Oligoflexales bacterium]